MMQSLMLGKKVSLGSEVDGLVLIMYPSCLFGDFRLPLQLKRMNIESHWIAVARD
jgi:hypothetical protein